MSRILTEEFQNQSESPLDGEVYAEWLESELIKARQEVKKWFDLHQSLTKYNAEVEAERDELVKATDELLRLMGEDTIELVGYQYIHNETKNAKRIRELRNRILELKGV